MKFLKLWIFIAFIFLLMVSAWAAEIVLPSESHVFWSNDGNVMNDFNSQGSYSYTGFSSNRVSSLAYVNESDYASCFIGSSTTLEPVIVYEYWSSSYDFGYPLIWLVNGANIYIYTLDCELVQIITNQYAFVGQPQIIYSSPAYQYIVRGAHQVAIATNQSMLMYWYNYTSNLYSLVYNVSLNRSIFNFVCDERGEIGDCFLFNNSRDILKLDLASGSITTLTNSLTTGYYSPAFTYPHSFPITYLNFPNQPIYARFAQCALTGARGSCSIMNQDGAFIFNTSDFPLNPPSYIAFQPYDTNAFIAKVGTQFKIFVSYNQEVTSGGDMYQYGTWLISDITSETNTVIQYIQGAPQYTSADRKSVSNWAVADWNKDGVNEACILHRTASPYFVGANFTCYNSIGGEVFDEAVGGIMSVSNIVLADFVPQSDYLAIGTKEGIFAFDGTPSIYKFVGTAYNSTNDFGHVMVTGWFTNEGVNGAPFLVYSGLTESFILKTSLSSIICGDSICSAGYENSLSCPADCNQFSFKNLSGAYVGNDCSSCWSGYCEYGYCSHAPAGYDCTDNSQCLSNNCSNGHCTKANLWDSLEQSKKAQFGSGTNTDNLISLFFMFGIAVGLVIMGRGSAAAIIGGGASFVALGIFFTAVGWLSPWILVGGFLIIIILAILAASIMR